MVRMGMLGVGAIGIPLGYFFSQKEKNEVVFLARDSRVEALRGEQVLLNYDKNLLEKYTINNVLSTQPLLENSGDIPEEYSFDVVVITIPTDVLYTAEGSTLLKSLVEIGNNTTFLILSPGYTLYESIFEPAGVKRKNVVFGLPLLLSHELEKVRFKVGEKYESNLDQATLAYHMLWNQKKVIVLAKKPKHLKKALKNCGRGALSLSFKQMEAGVAMVLILNLLLQLQNYPKKLKKDASFTAAMKAWAQTTKDYGCLGFFARKTTGKGAYKFSDMMNRRFSRPLGTDFLAYHHGGKVKEQNLKVLEKYSKGDDAVAAFVALCRDN